MNKSKKVFRGKRGSFSLHEEIYSDLKVFIYVTAWALALILVGIPLICLLFALIKQ